MIIKNLIKDILEFLFFFILNYFPLIIYNLAEIIIMFELYVLRDLYYFFGHLFSNNSLLKTAADLNADYLTFLCKVDICNIIKQRYWHLPYVYSESETASSLLLGYRLTMTDEIIYITQILVSGLFVFFIALMLYYLLKVTNSFFYISNFFFICTSIIGMYSYLFLILEVYLNKAIPLQVYNGLFLLFLLWLIVWLSIIFLLMFIFFTVKGYNFNLYTEYIYFIFYINLIFVILCIINIIFLFNRHIVIFSIFIIFFFIKSFYDFIKK